jgi:hypothetical protein
VTDPRPLLEGEPSEAERLLLTSARLDKPPADGRARALVALGLAAGLGTAATSGTAAASPLDAALRVKWLAVGAFSGAVVAASVATVVHYVDVGREPATAIANAGAARAPVGASLPVGSNDVAVTAEPPVPANRPSAAQVAVTENPPAGRPTPAPHRAAQPAPAPSQGLSAEIAAFDRARQAMARGDASQALTLLDEYDATFRARTFSQEAMVLRVEVLHALGRDRDAARLGERLLASAPASAHAQRIRSLLASLHSQK